MNNFVSSSPYSTTSQTIWYTNKLKLRTIPKDNSDYEFIITNEYANKPGKASFDIYGDSLLKWVFLVTNRSLFPKNDIINEFTVGKILLIPTKERLLSMIG